MSADKIAPISLILRQHVIWPTATYLYNFPIKKIAWWKGRISHNYLFDLKVFLTNMFNHIGLTAQRLT